MPSKTDDASGSPAPSPGFLRSATLMLGGAAGAQVINFLAMPLLARLFPPEAIGVHALFVSIAAALTVLASLRLDLAIVLPESDETAARIWWTAFYQGLATAVIVLFAALILRDWIHDAFTATLSSAWWVLLLAPMLLASVVTQLGIGLATRLGRFRLVVLANLTTAAVFAASAVSIGAIAAGDSGVVVSRLLGQCAGCLFLVAIVIDSTRRYRSWRPSRLDVLDVWQRQRQFLVFNTPYSLVGSLARDVPLYVFAVGGGAAVAATYALARTIMLAPTTLLSAALSSVFYREAAQHLGTPRLKTLALMLTRWGLLLSIPAFAFVVAWGDSLFVLVFGPSWESAGELARILAVPMWLALQTGWPERLFEAARRQGVSFALQMSFDALHAVVVVVVYVSTGSPALTVAAYAVTYSAFHICYLVTVFHVAGFGFSGLGRIAAVAAPCFVAVVAAFLLARHLLPLTTGTGFVLAATATILLTTAIVIVGWMGRFHHSSSA